MTLLVGEPGAALPAGAGAGAASSDWVQDTLADLTALRAGVGMGWLRIRRPTPTAAFSRRDALTPGYGQAVEVARQHGFLPLVRPVGGRLAVHHDGAVVIDVLGRHEDPGRDLQGRFRVFGAAVVSAMRTLGVDARVGRVPDEYCPGDHSVNARGRVKLAGTAQRLTRGSYWLSAVVMVSDADPVRVVLSETYPLLGLPFDPATFGAVGDEVPGFTDDDVAAVLQQALSRVLPVAGTATAPSPGELVRLPLEGCWDTVP